MAEVWYVTVSPGHTTETQKISGPEAIPPNPLIIEPLLLNIDPWKLDQNGYIDFRSSTEEENAISHRGIAFRKVVDFFENLYKE